MKVVLFACSVTIKLLPCSLLFPHYPVAHLSPVPKAGHTPLPQGRSPRLLPSSSAAGGDPEPPAFAAVPPIPWFLVLGGPQEPWEGGGGLLAQGSITMRVLGFSLCPWGSTLDPPSMGGKDPFPRGGRYWGATRELLPPPRLGDGRTLPPQASERRRPLGGARPAEQREA